MDPQFIATLLAPGMSPAEIKKVNEQYLEGALRTFRFCLNNWKSPREFYWQFLKRSPNIVFPLEEVVRFYEKQCGPRYCLIVIGLIGNPQVLDILPSMSIYTVDVSTVAKRVIESANGFVASFTEYYMNQRWIHSTYQVKIMTEFNRNGYY